MIILIVSHNDDIINDGNNDENDDNDDEDDVNVSLALSSPCKDSFHSNSPSLLGWCFRQLA